MSKFSIIVVILSFTVHELVCQVESITSRNVIPETGIVSGKIIDASTQQAISGAQVFLNFTTLATTTSVEGSFQIFNARPNTIYDLIVFSSQYETYVTRVSPTTGEINLGNIALIKSPVTGNINRVVSEKKKIARYRKILLGSEKAARQCYIRNPEVLNFSEEDKTLSKVTLSAPLRVSNEYLGYEVRLYPGAEGIRYVWFESQQSSSEQTLEQWSKNRDAAYNRSSHHLFKSFINQRIKGEGFELYRIKSESTAERGYPSFREKLGKTIVAYDTASLAYPTSQKEIFRIELNGKVEVHYKKEIAGSRIYSDLDNPISWIRFKKGFALVNTEGILINPADVEISGAMSSAELALAVPSDFKPTNRLFIEKEQEKLQNLAPYLYEKVYVHTDKPYYYPGETIWFKGYINYSTPAFRDSLSRTVYAELIHGPSQKIVSSKILLIDSGFFQGDFILKDTTRSADYFLRAYTTLSRNYGDNNLYSKYIPVLSILDKPKVVSENHTVSSGLTITSNKALYKPREKIELTLRVKDDEGNPAASHLSISVTDANQVLNFDTVNILSEYPIKEIPYSRLSTSRPIEFGIGFKAQFKTENNKTEKGTVHIYQVNPQNFFMVDTDDEGIFSLNNLFFYDSAKFAFQVLKDNKMVYGRPHIFPRNVPSFTYVAANRNFELIKMQAPQRDKSTFEIPFDATLLNEITVKASRIEEAPKQRIYGKPDYILEAKDLNTSYGNLLLTLPGKIPGLVVRQSNANEQDSRWVVYTQRGGSSSISNAKEVVVVVNDVIMGGNPADILSALDPATVETIELKNGLSPLLGGIGNSGVLYIYTKKGISNAAPEINGVPFCKINGYAMPRRFVSPNHEFSEENSPVDFRSLLYWNPAVKTIRNAGGSIVTFFASDLKGRYRVIVEGITDKNQPVRGEFIISVED